ncbi:MAG: hypothetical protein ABI557_18315 [Aureliella sp.]
MSMRGSSNHQFYPYVSAISLVVLLNTYAVSFTLPVTDANTRHAMYGYQAFIYGFFSVIYLPMWMANPLFWIGCVHLNRNRWKSASRAGLCAVLLALSEIYQWDDRPEIGYLVWLSSMVLLTLVAVAMRLSESIGTCEPYSKPDREYGNTDSSELRLWFPNFAKSSRPAKTA